MLCKYLWHSGSNNTLKYVFLTFILFHFGLSLCSQTFQEEWENGKLSFPPWVQEGHSNSLSTDYALSGGFSYKSELPVQVYSNARSEVRFEGNGTVPKFQDQFTTWGISFSMYVPSDFKPDPTRESILQLKDIMDPCDIAGGNPPFKIGLEKYELSATVRWTDQRCATELGLEYFGKLMHIEPGKWHHFVLNVGWDYRDNGNGFIELFASIDSPPTPDDKILDYRGPTGYNNNFGHYLKLGIYKWLWKQQEYVNESRSAGVTKRVLYYDNISIKKNKIGLTMNKEPEANAGPSKVITLPNNHLAINGLGSDPDGSIVNYWWEQVSGPAEARLNGQDTENLDISELVEGTYVFRLTVTDNLGSSASDEMFVSVEPPISEDPIANAGPNITLLLPTSKAKLSGSVSGNSKGDFDFTWNQLSGPSEASMTDLNDTEVEVENLIEGTYVFQFIIEDSSGVADSDQVEVSLLAATPIVTADLLDATCQANDGAIFLKLNGGKGPFSYSWSTGATTKDLENLTAGKYQVSIADQNGTLISKYFTVESSETKMTVTAEISRASCSNNDGAIRILVDGGVAPYQYKWSNGPRTATAKDLAAGKYQVVVTDKNGCSKEVSYNVQVDPGSTKFKLTSQVENANCSGAGGSISLQMAGGNGGYSFTWTTGDNGSRLADLEIGRYQVLITDKHGCFMKSEYTIYQDSLPTPNITQSGDILSIDQQADHYQWYKEGVVIEGADQNLLKITEPGNYLVQTSLGNRCTATSKPLYVEIPRPTARVSQTINQVDLFPNPVADNLNLQIHLSASAEANVSIHDFLGNVVMDQNLGIVNAHFVEKLNLSHYPSGVYIIKINAGQEVVSRRFIKH